MEILASVIGGALVMAVGGADLKVACRGRRDDRRAVLAGRVGTHLTIVDRAQTVSGLVRRVGRHGVELRRPGAEVHVPFDSIVEVWNGSRLLRRW